MFPVYSVSGKVGAFGGRVLKSGVKISKYFNSPESEIYHKSNELYGIFQAKRAIEKEKCCYLVEGYTDVLSMHQSGIENVVASSGTALTPGQIRLIHRFTNDITVLYDGDAAGIKASLRGIDLILQEGLNIKVVLLPDGEDPDSFAKSQSAESFKQYIKSHETDFIRFKTQLLLDEAGSDPIKRASIISNIVQSISLIPDAIVRSVYVQECSRLLQISEQILITELNKIRKKRAEQQAPRERYQQPESRPAQPPVTPESFGNIPSDNTPLPDSETPPPPSLDDTPITIEEMERLSQTGLLPNPKKTNPLDVHERALVRYLIRYGYRDLFEIEDGKWQKVWSYITEELAADQIVLSNALYNRTFEMAQQQQALYNRQSTALQEKLQIEAKDLLHKCIEKIALNGKDLKDMQQKEKEAQIKIAQQVKQKQIEFDNNFLERFFTTHPDTDISLLAVDLVSEKYQLSKIHTKFQKIETESDRLWELIPRAIDELKYAILEQNIKQVQAQIKEAAKNQDNALVTELMGVNVELNQLRSLLAKQIGERIVSPKQ